MDPPAPALPAARYVDPEFGFGFELPPGYARTDDAAAREALAVSVARDPAGMAAMLASERELASFRSPEGRISARFAPAPASAHLGGVLLTLRDGTQLALSEDVWAPLPVGDRELPGADLVLRVGDRTARQSLLAFEVAGGSVLLSATAATPEALAPGRSAIRAVALP